MAPFPGHNRPGASLSPAEKWSAVMPLPIAVVVISPPARPFGRIDLQRLVDHLQRIDDQRVIRAPYAVAHQLQKSGVHNLARLEYRFLPRPSIRDLQHPLAHVFAEVALAPARWIDANEMPLHLRIEHPVAFD